MYRIIIADDEAIECRALEMMIQNEFSTLEVMPSVYNGADFIASVEKYHPDIAVLDINMPLLGGLDALELIRIRNRDIKIIISSAYSEFDYVKRAMKLGVSDYILKPVEKENFAATLGKVIQDLQKERREASREKNNQQHLDEMTAVVGNEFLSSLMLGEPDEKSFSLYQKALNQEYRGGFLLAARNLDPDRNKEREKEVMKNMEQELRKFCGCIGKSYKDEMYFLLFPGAKIVQQNVRQWLEDILKLLQEAVKKQGENHFCFGVSTCKYDCEEMAGGLAECRIAVRSQTHPGVFYYETPKHQKKETVLESPLGSLSRKCLDAVKKGEPELCRKLTEEALKNIDFEEALPERIQMQVLEFILPLCEYMEEGQDYLVRYSKAARIDYGELHRCISRESLQRWIDECLEKLSLKAELREKKSRDYLERTLIYIEQHYREDISLEQAAESSGISPFYLSRLLKQELKQTFVEILTHIRMERALSLLWKGNYSAKEIAEQTGYSNITYFYKVFKKYTGMNIGEMREYLQ